VICVLDQSAPMNGHLLNVTEFSVPLQRKETLTYNMSIGLMYRCNHC
jgi:hypothetical protein